MEKLNRKTEDLVYLYNKIAHKYDELGKQSGWHSPQVLFGLHFDFIKAGEKILDLGIGTGLSSELYYRVGLEIYGIDGSSSMIDICRKKGFIKHLHTYNLNHLDHEQLPYPNNCFDHIISNGVLYFLKNLEPVFREAKRILKNDGIFGFTLETKEGKDISSRVIFVKEAYGPIKLNCDIEFPIFSHGKKYIEELVNSYGFEHLISPLKFYAYYSPSEKKDIYFDAYLLKKR